MVCILLINALIVLYFGLLCLRMFVFGCLFDSCLFGFDLFVEFACGLVCGFVRFVLCVDFRCLVLYCNSVGLSFLVVWFLLVILFVYGCLRLVMFVCVLFVVFIWVGLLVCCFWLWFRCCYCWFSIYLLFGRIACCLVYLIVLLFTMFAYVWLLFILGLLDYCLVVLFCDCFLLFVCVCGFAYTGGRLLGLSLLRSAFCLWFDVGLTCWWFCFTFGLFNSVAEIFLF